jgi:thioredoxin-related protein
MQKATIICTLFICVFLFASFEKPDKKDDLWQEWSTIMKLRSQEKKPILIDVYTTWCIYCKKMDAKTYKSDSVRNYLKEHFYRFKFNAESKDSLEWNGKMYGFNSRYKIHDLVANFAQSIAFPTTVVIPPDGQPFSISGELDVKEMETILKYFNGAYPDKDMAGFARGLKNTWK